MILNSPEPNTTTTTTAGDEEEELVKCSSSSSQQQQHHLEETSYVDVMYQGKKGNLTINSEKITFQAEISDNNNKTSSRSWRWAFISRVEVMDPSRGSSYRDLKLKSPTGKTSTLAVPNNQMLQDIVKDMNERLIAQPNSLGMEGPIQTKTCLQHKTQPPPAGRKQRRASTMTSLPAATTSTTTSTTRAGPIKNAAQRRGTMPVFKHPDIGL